MSDYLTHLVARALGTAPLVQPRPVYRFEDGDPAPAVSEQVVETFAAERLAAATQGPPPGTGMARRPASAPRAVSEPYGGIPAPLERPVPSEPSRPTLEEAEAEARGAAGADPGAAVQTAPRREPSRRRDGSPAAAVTPPSTALLEMESAASERGASEAAAAAPSRPAVHSATIQAEVLRPARETIPTDAPPVSPLGTGRDRGAQDERAADEGETTLRITIGRIEVRTAAPPPAPKPAAPERRSPALSLDEYLRPRGGAQ